MRIFIVIPTYNEAANLPELFARLNALGLANAEIVIVDDASPDDTAEVARGLGSAYPVNVLVRNEERGIGGALTRGLRHALDAGAEVVVTMDADLSHAPEVLPELILQIKEGAHLSLGSRRVSGGSVDGWSRTRDLVSRSAAAVSRWLLGLKARDVTTGLRAYSAPLLRSIDLDGIDSQGYAFQEEMVMRAEQGGFKVVEVPIRFIDRVRGVSKLSFGESLGSFFSLAKVRLRTIDRRHLWPLIVLLTVALMFRLFLAPQKGCAYDLWAFSKWAANGLPLNFLTFFSNSLGPTLTFPNYALYFPILAFLGPAADAGLAVGRILLKWPSIVTDLILGSVIFFAVPRRWSLAAAAFFLFNPVAWYTSAVWGQTDVFHALFMVLSVLAAKEQKYRRAWCWAVVGIFFKLQAIAVIPLIVVLHWRDVGFRRFFRELVPAGLLGVLLSLPFVIATSLSQVWTSLFKVVGTFALVSINAWNPWYLLHKISGRWVSDMETFWGPIQYYHIGFLLYALMMFTVLAVLPRRPDRRTLMAAAALSCFAFYLFPTEMHERYLYPLIPFAALMFFDGLVPLIVSLVMTTVIFLGMNMVEPWHPLLLKISLWGDGVPYVFVNLLVFGALFFWYRRTARRSVEVRAE